MEILIIFGQFLLQNIEVCIILRNMVTLVCNSSTNLSNSFEISIWISPHWADQDEPLPIVSCTVDIVTWLKCTLFNCQRTKPLLGDKIINWSLLKQVHILLFIFNEMRGCWSQSLIEKNHFVVSSFPENPYTTTVSR